MALLLYFADSVSLRFGPEKWQPGNLYAAIFDWSAIQSGFVFAIYGFIVTKKDGFTGKLLGGDTFERFLGFTRRACFGGFLLTVVSLPLVVMSPAVDSSDFVTYSIISSWFAFFIWGFFAFLRVAFTFGMIVGTPDKPDRIPG